MTWNITRSLRTRIIFVALAFIFSSYSEPSGRGYWTDVGYDEEDMSNEELLDKFSVSAPFLVLYLLATGGTWLYFQKQRKKKVTEKEYEKQEIEKNKDCTWGCLWFISLIIGGFYALYSISLLWKIIVTYILSPTLYTISWSIKWGISIILLLLVTIGIPWGTYLFLKYYSKTLAVIVSLILLYAIVKLLFLYGMTIIENSYFLFPNFNFKID